MKARALSFIQSVEAYVESLLKRHALKILVHYGTRPNFRVLENNNPNRVEPFETLVFVRKMCIFVQERLVVVIVSIPVLV